MAALYVAVWVAAVVHPRNHCDCIVHLAFGLLITIPAPEPWIRLGHVTPGWASLSAVLALGALSGHFEVLEALVAEIVSPELGQAYLGTQGDV